MRKNKKSDYNTDTVVTADDVDKNIKTIIRTGNRIVKLDLERLAEFGSMVFFWLTCAFLSVAIPAIITVLWWR